MKLKIFNLNCWLLPPPISAENNKRIEEIISLVNHTRPDVIMLQEVWLNKYVNKFKNGLQNYSFIATEGKSFNKSGLLTGLKIPYSSHKINFFNHVKGYNVIEKIASKGYHLIHISKDIYLINTHLYAPIKSSNRKITKLQFNLLKKFSKDKKVILAGDLNLEEKDLSQLNNTFNYKSHGIYTSVQSNKYHKTRLNKLSHEKNKKLDYVLVKEKMKYTVREKVLKSPVVSDHLTIITNIKI